MLRREEIAEKIQEKVTYDQSRRYTQVDHREIVGTIRDILDLDDEKRADFLGFLKLFVCLNCGREIHQVDGCVCARDK